MKRWIALWLAAILVMSLCACGGGPANSAAATGEASISAQSGIDNAGADAAEPSEEPVEIDESPKTATEPPALRREDLPNPDGAPSVILWGEEDCDVIMDRGEDGRTLTKNGFDEDGNLIWWEAFSFNEAELPVEGITKTPDGTVLRREEIVYDPGGTKTSSKSFDEQDNLTAEYTYHEDGSLESAGLYHPDGTQRELINYNLAGNEAYRAEYDETGELVREYKDGYLVVEFPEYVDEIMTMLNETADEDFEETFASCERHLDLKNLNEDWDYLCNTLSATLDALGTPLLAMYEQYHLASLSDSRYFGYVRELIDNGLNPALQAAVYREDCHLNFGRTAWVPGMFWSAVPDTIPDRTEGDRIHVVYLDSSSTIGVDGPGFMDITLGNLEDEQLSEAIRDRMNDILNGVVLDEYYKYIEFEADPGLADVVFEVNTTYDYVATYSYEDGDTAEVYATIVDLTAYDMRSDRTASVRFSHIPGDTIYGLGSVIWMRIPDFEEEPYRSDADAFVAEIISWYDVDVS